MRLFHASQVNLSASLREASKRLFNGMAWVNMADQLAAESRELDVLIQGC
jgi:hypothetical protein